MINLSRVQKYFEKIKQISAVIVLSMAIFSQTSAAVEKGVNISGTLFNAANREPVQTMIIFIDDAGEEIKARSENNGQYQATLIPGKKYSIAVENNIVVNESEEFVQIPKNTSGETRKNFELAKILPGVELLASNAFGDNKEVINADALTHIIKLKTFLNINTNTRIKIFISAEDTYISDEKLNKSDETSSKSKKSKKSKRAKKNKSSKDKAITASDSKLSSADRIKKLVNRRASNMRDIFTSMRIMEDRYTIEEIAIGADKPIAKSKKSKSKSIQEITEVINSEMKLITLKVEIAQ